MKLTIYHLKNCDTCKKAIKALEAAGHELNQVDVRADGVPPTTLAEIVQKVGWETLLNNRSTTWRGLSDDEKSQMNETKALTLMTSHPTLIKRPVITNGDVITVGWKSDTQAMWQ